MLLKLLLNGRRKGRQRVEDYAGWGKYLVLVLDARTHCWDYAGEQRNAEWLSEKGDKVLKDVFSLQRFPFSHLLRWYLEKFYPLFKQKELYCPLTTHKLPVPGLK